MTFDPKKKFEENLEEFKEKIEEIDVECAEILFRNIDILLQNSDGEKDRKLISEFNEKVRIDLETLDASPKDSKK